MHFTEKIKLIRTAKNLTQAEFANAIGISRGNLSGLELGKVSPTPLLINCLSLMFGVDKKWLIDDDNEDLSALNDLSADRSETMRQYELLDEEGKKLVRDLIFQLAQKQDKERASH